MLRTVELAIADARRQGIDVAVMPMDDREDEAEAALVATQLAVNFSVIAVIGHKNSGPSGAAGPIYAAAGLPQVTQCSTDTALSRAGWRTFFRLCADNERQATVAANFAYSEFGAARVVSVHDGTSYGRPLVEAFAQRFEALAGRPVTVMEMHVGQEDFSELVEAIRGTHADVVQVGATEIESSKLMRAMHGAAIQVRVISAEGGPDNPLARLAGPAGEGSVHTYAGADPMGTTASRELVSRCRAQIGETPSYVVECFDAVGVIARALAGGATTRTDVRAAIASTDIEGVGGRIRFDPRGDRIDPPVSLWRVEGGEMRPLPVGSRSPKSNAAG